MTFVRRCHSDGIQSITLPAAIWMGAADVLSVGEDAKSQHRYVKELARQDQRPCLVPEDRRTGRSASAVDHERIGDFQHCSQV